MKRHHIWLLAAAGALAVLSHPLYGLALLPLGMALSEGNYLGDWLMEEYGAPNFCRKEVTIVSGAGVLRSGTVLGKITATGKYAPYDDDNGDGTETAAAILISPVVDAASADALATVLVRGPAIIKKQGLTWAATNDAGDITAGLADLAAIEDIIIREGV